MRIREVREKLEYQYSSGSEEDCALNKRGSTLRQIKPSSGGQQALNAIRRRRSAAQRRYSDLISSGDDGDEYDDDLEFGKATTESHKRAKRHVS